MPLSQRSALLAFGVFSDPGINVTVAGNLSKKGQFAEKLMNLTEFSREVSSKYEKASVLYCVSFCNLHYRNEIHLTSLLNSETEYQSLIG